MTSLFWSETARRDLRRIRAFLEPNDPDLAAAALTSIEGASRRLKQPPMLGPPVGSGVNRKLSVTDYHYVIIYRIEPQRIVISRVHHAEDWFAL